jgi:peptide/nickel transport system permease protein
VLRFALQRSGQTAVVVVLVVTISFTLAHLAPGDPFTSFDEPGTATVDRATLRAQWGYDLPVWRQYVRWVANFASGDFGWSHSRAQPVSAVLRDAVPNTLVLMLPAVCLGLLAGVALGTWQAARRGSLLERASGTATLTLISIPEFIVALTVLLVVAVRWQLAPVSGMVDPVRHDALSLTGRVRDVLAHLVLPGSTLAALIAASVSRYQRAAVLLVLPEDFLRTARAKGATLRRVLLRHALRNALGPVITIAGLLLPAVFGGTVFIERVFAWPGMGLTLVEAVAGRDYPLVQAIVLVGTTLVAAGGAAADVLAAAANPRAGLAA